MVRVSATLSPIVVGLSLLLSSPVHAQGYLYWPVPGHSDIRGTFGDYWEHADGSPKFHNGIDIHAPGDTYVDCVVDCVIVEQIGFDVNGGYQFDVADLIRRWFVAFP